MIMSIKWQGTVNRSVVFAMPTTRYVLQGRRHQAGHISLMIVIPVLDAALYEKYVRA